MSAILASLKEFNFFSAVVRLIDPFANLFLISVVNTDDSRVKLIVSMGRLRCLQIPVRITECLSGNPTPRTRLRWRRICGADMIIILRTATQQSLYSSLFPVTRNADKMTAHLNTHGFCGAPCHGIVIPLISSAVIRCCFGRYRRIHFRIIILADKSAVGNRIKARSGSVVRAVDPFPDLFILWIIIADNASI